MGGLLSLMAQRHCLRMDMELFTVDLGRQSLFANRYPNTNQTAFCTALYKTIQGFCHRMVCTNKTHIEQQTQQNSPYSS